MKYGKYIRWLLLTVVIVLSVKPVLFSWHLLRAGFSTGEKRGAAIVDALYYQPSLYRFFNEQQPGAVEHYLLKTAVYTNDRGILDQYNQRKPRLAPGLNDYFRDNFFFHHLMGTIDKGSNKTWANLDDVTLEIMADKTMNAKTLAILKKIHRGLEPMLIRNLVAYTHWQGNRELSQQLKNDYPVLPGKGIPDDAVPVAVDSKISGDSLHLFLVEKYKLRASGLSENLLAAAGFNSFPEFERNWYYSRMARENKFARGSFAMGLDPLDQKEEAGQKKPGKTVEKSGKGDSITVNRSVRLMGFFTERQTGKSRPRTGVRYRHHIPATNGFYIFCFDYCTVTGKEYPSFLVAGGLKEIHLHHTKKEWKKVVLIINNAFNDYNSMNPLIRMWGTGTLRVDNVSLFKVTDTAFSIETPFIREVISYDSLAGEGIQP